jgi:hypothetical protein
LQKKNCLVETTINYRFCKKYLLFSLSLNVYRYLIYFLLKNDKYLGTMEYVMKSYKIVYTLIDQMNT